MLNSFLRLYLLFLIPCSIALGVGFYYSYSKQIEKTQGDFEKNYDNQAQIYADQILDIEHSYDVIMRNAILGIEQENINLNTDVEVLKGLTKKYNISHLFLIDKNGVFKRSTNEDPKKIPNFFGFSKLYKELQAKSDLFLTTPIIIPFPETVPHKFLTIWTGQYYIELGVRIKDIADKIEKILKRDRNVLNAVIGISSTRYTINSNEITESYYKATKVIKSSNINYVQSESRHSHNYSLDLLISKKNLRKEIENVKSRHLTNFLLTIVLLTLVLFFATKYLSSKIQKLTRILNKLSDRSTSKENLSIKTKSDDLNDLTSAINTFAKKYGEHFAENEKVSAVNNIVTQVAHDIRSPLEALKSSRKELSKLSEDERLKMNTAINRIEDIAYTLLKKKKEDSSDFKSDIQSSIEHILIEKRMQYRQHHELIINYDKSDDNFSIFANIRSTTFKNIISNIISNSAEAMCYKGNIHISLNKVSNFIQLKISDNGKGFSPQYLETPFSEGITEKINGNGLGLSQAKKELIKVDGNISLVNNNGAEVIINLKQIQAPNYSVGAINLKGLSKIIILDDDDNIHNIWKSRFKDYDIKLEHFSSGIDMLKAYTFIPNNALLLSDYELINEKRNGIDYIKELNAIDSSILVTARSDESEIINKIVQNTIKLLPKILASDIPILNETISNSLVLIDDDDLVHMNWKIEMKRKGIKLVSFYSINDFLAVCSNYSLSTPIYLDSDLKDGTRGEIDGIKIFNKGYKNINITTGYSDLKKPLWIKAVLNKSPHQINLV